MSLLSHLNLVTGLQFFLALVGNLAAVSFLPKTEGFSKLGYNFLCLACMGLTLWMLARLMHKGAPLSILIPVFTIVIPVGSIIIGYYLYQESSSLLSITLILAACVLVFIAAYV